MLKPQSRLNIESIHEHYQWTSKRTLLRSGSLDGHYRAVLSFQIVPSQFDIVDHNDMIAKSTGM
jgi:hypothetical protein